MKQCSFWLFLTIIFNFLFQVQWCSDLSNNSSPSTDCLRRVESTNSLQSQQPENLHHSLQLRRPTLSPLNISEINPRDNELSFSHQNRIIKQRSATTEYHRLKRLVDHTENPEQLANVCNLWNQFVFDHLRTIQSYGLLSEENIANLNNDSSSLKGHWRLIISIYLGLCRKIKEMGLPAGQAVAAIDTLWSPRSSDVEIFNYKVTSPSSSFSASSRETEAHLQVPSSWQDAINEFETLSQGQSPAQMPAPPPSNNLSPLSSGGSSHSMSRSNQK